jgi:drug/metabolite transporter (DMT)-like permease
MTTQLWAIGIMISGTLIGAFGPIFFKKSANTFSLNPFKLLKNYYFIAGCFMYAIGTLFGIIALIGGELSVLYSFVSLVYIWTAFLSVKLLNEKMNFLKWLGILVIVAGISLIGLGM